MKRGSEDRLEEESNKKKGILLRRRAIEKQPKVFDALYVYQHLPSSVPPLQTLHIVRPGRPASQATLDKHSIDREGA